MPQQVAVEALVEEDNGTAARFSARSRAWLVILTLLLGLGAAIPVVMVKTPIMVDFFNHLGGIYVIAHRDDDPLLARYYTVHWRLIPNLAMDLLAPPLAHLVGIYAAGKIFVLATMAMLIGGVYAVAASLYGRVSLWPLAAFLFVYNWIFLYGFINYLFGVGLALWAFAAWIRWREAPAPARGLLSLLLVVLLFACHLYTVGLYGLALICYEFWRLRERGAPPLRRLAGEAAALALPFIAVLLLLSASPTGDYAAATYWRLPEKLDGLYFLVKTYWAPGDLAFAAFCAGAVFWGWRTRRLTLHPAGFFLLVAGIAIYLVMPTKLFGSGIADMRLPIALAFFLIAMARWDMRAPATPPVFGAVVVLVAMLRFLLIGIAWHGYDREVGEFERSFASIARGSRVLVAGDYRDGTSFTRRTMLQHIPCLVMIERSSLESLAFAHPGKQVLQVSPDYQAAALAEPMPPDIAMLLGDQAMGRGSDDQAVWFGWRRKYDYVYVLYGGAGQALAAPGLVLLDAGRGFQLYRILH